MQITYENEWGYTEVHVDISVSYKENYRLKMLEYNQVSGLLKLRGSGRDEGSRYTYSLESGMISMKKYFSDREMSLDDIRKFTEQLVSVISELKCFFLDPSGLLLSPELIFKKEDRYYFCYLPAEKEEVRKSLCRAFHEITEYFVKKLDYRDNEGIFFVYRIHKETMEENYELEKILMEYEEERKQRKRVKDDSNHVKQNDLTEEEENLTGISEGAVFSIDDQDEKINVNKYNMKQDMEKIADNSQEYGPLKKVMRKIKTGYWGEWEDLITEMDRQKENGNL